MSNDSAVRDGPRSKRGLARNMLQALDCVPEGWGVVVMEDDDWYGPTYVEDVEAALGQHDIVGPRQCRYYHVPSRRWHTRYDCRACAPSLGEVALAFTSWRPGLSGRIKKEFAYCASNGAAACGRVWGGAKATVESLPCVAIKGLPGCGVSAKHDLERSKKMGHEWALDEGRKPGTVGTKKLTEWIGHDDCLTIMEAAG